MEANGIKRAPEENGCQKMPFGKYRAFQSWYKIQFDEKWTQRSWPSKQLTKAPRWLSTDLRDGNQSLVNPMDHEKKLRMFLHLVKLGYKEIEVGFPSASQTDFDFLRYIIDNGLIPDDCWIQVLIPAREALIKRSVEGVKGAKNVVLHMYNSTSELQRRVVFEKSREDIKQMALEGIKLLKSLADAQLSASNVRLEYSPESFTGTELDFALDVCEAVVEIWQPTPEHQVILNLPSTVEMCTPNVYADQIEWMCAHLSHRELVCISVHPHNDRGTGIAAAELALMAGADRVEGCLFGSGERTGNVCLVTLAINFLTQGIDPEVNYSDIQETIDIAEACTELTVPERYPWAGSLVYTAFSGSHQDAIKKGISKMNGGYWEVPYLPIDPKDLGRSYEAIIRVNSQSGKSGIAYLLEAEYGIPLPKECQIEFSQVIQGVTDKSGREISAKDIYESFLSHYIEDQAPLVLVDYQLPSDGTVEVESSVSIVANVRVFGEVQTVRGEGNGPLSAFVDAINTSLLHPLGTGVTLLQYQSAARAACKAEAQSQAVCSIQLQASSKDQKIGKPKFGIGLHANTTTAALRAVVSAVRCLEGADGRVLSAEKPAAAALC